MQTAPALFSYPKYWAECLLPAPVLPMCRAEMDVLGWDSCDVIIITGDAYVDHPSFGMAVIGRMLEAQGFRVGIIAQPDWKNVADFRQLGQPNLFFGVTGGNMDSMVNRYTSDRRIRSNDSYTPNDAGGKRPDRAVQVYAHRAREAYKNTPIIIGGIEASLRRLAHYDYWSDKVRRAILVDAKADLLVFGNGERSIVEIAHRLSRGEAIQDINNVRGTAMMRSTLPEDWQAIDAQQVDVSDAPPPVSENPYEQPRGCASAAKAKDISVVRVSKLRVVREKTYLQLPSFEQVCTDKALYAHTSRVFHLETNPGNARAMAQQHGRRYVWLNPPPIPLKTPELDGVFELPYSRKPHPIYGDARIPAYEMIRFSVSIMRGCFGGCTFCSITEHEGRIIQNRSEDSVVKEIERIRDETPGFTGHISDVGGPTANMYRLHCKSPKIESACRRLSCVYPGICPNLNTDHQPLINLYRRVRKIEGVKKVFVASGLRYDLAVQSPEYVKELVTHHVGGYLKIAPEHIEEGPLSKMMKPGVGTYDRFKQLFDRYSKEAGKEQYLIPYFISSHPGSSAEDMLNLALWLKEKGFRPDQVQNFLPSPMALASAMYWTGIDPLKRVRRNSEAMFVAKGHRARRLQKALLRYHDPKNWPLLRETLTAMGRTDLIGNGKRHLVCTGQTRKPLPGQVQGKSARSGVRAKSRMSRKRRQ